VSKYQVNNIVLASGLLRPIRTRLSS